MRKQVLILLMMLFPFFAFSQSFEITGKVIDETDNMPIPGVTIVIKGSTSGTITDFDGNYKLSANAGDVLVFSFVGMENQEFTVADASPINVTMKGSIVSLDELVVVGYGVQKKSLVTGAISKLSSDELIATQPQRVEQAIQGKVSGVTVASESGSPGAGITIKIRGTSSNGNSDPLYIVDGMRTGGIDYLDPSDIESIEILKDAASAAIYGAQGGNGVVLITTKKGKAGQTQVTYNAYFGNQYYIDKLKVLDANQYIDYYQKAISYETRGKFPTQTDDFINARIASALTSYGLPQIGEEYTGPNTDWLNEVTNTAPMMSHNLGISGGTDKTTYSSSVNYFSQEGITGGDKSAFKRMTARLNMEHKANDYLTVGIKATYSRRERKSLSENSEFGGLYGNALMLDPLTPVVYAHDSLINPNYLGLGYDDLFVRNDAGQAFGMSSLVRNEIANPLAQVQTAHGNWGEDKVLAGAFVEIEPIKGLKFKTSYDVDVANAMYESWTETYFYHNLNKNETSSGYQSQDNYRTWQFDNLLSYFKTIGDHSFSVMGGTHAEEYTHNQLTGWGQDLIREAYPFSHPANAQNLPTETDLTVGDTTVTYNLPVSAASAIGGYRETPRRLASLFGRFTYNYAEKYMLNVTVRQDKSSMLSEKETYQKGLFPSYSLGWVVSKENFWTVSFIDFLKVRYSYGTNGSLGPLSPYMYVPLISFEGYPYMDAIGTVLQGTAPERLSNDALAWEETGMHNVGVDFRFMNSKFSGSLEYYNKFTENLLTTANIPGYVGNNPPQANLGTIYNKGLEFELTYKNYDGEFQYEIGGNISYLTNSVDYFPAPVNGANLGVGGAVTRIEEGNPIFFLYGYKTDGVWKDQADIDANNYYTDENGAQVAIQQRVLPGDIKIKDVNGDNTINTDDRTMIGNPHPDVIAGMHFNANYKNFDLGINVSASFGNDVYMGIYRNDVGLANRPEHFYTDGWSPDNTGADFYRPTISSTWNFAHNDQYVEDGSFVKVKNVQLGYTLPRALSQKLQISKVRVYVSANNLFTFTKYHGSDPEMGNTAGLASFGIDRGFYPQARQFLAGVNVTF